MLVAVIFFVIFIVMLLGLLFVDGLANWWFLASIVGVSILFYFISMFAFVRMEFYDEAILTRHLLKPKQAHQIEWKEITSITIVHTQRHPYRVSVFISGRRTPFVFSMMNETDEVREKVLNAFREKGVKVNG